MDPRSERQLKSFTLVLILCAFLALVGVGLAVFGFGTIQDNTTNKFQLYVNGHHIASHTIKVRPGTYEVEVTSARYATSRKTIKVGLFGTTKVYNSTHPRDLDQLIRSVIAAYGSYGPPELNGAHWLESGTWLVGYVGPGSAAPIALKYTNDGWQVGYFTMTGYPHDLKILPSSVAAALESYTLHGQ
jgi:hypothetical protein